MEILDYSLYIQNKVLLEKTNLNFMVGHINHILGKNGVGKSVLAKDFILNRSGVIPNEVTNDVIVIGSYSNIPDDLTVAKHLAIVEKKYKSSSKDLIKKALNISEISNYQKISSLSDGQKQKLKLYTFLVMDTSYIILDEITNALDKTTVNQIQEFLKEYIERNPQKTIINITHNLSDLKMMGGNIYLFEDQKIEKMESYKDAVNRYVGDELYV